MFTWRKRFLMRDGLAPIPRLALPLEDAAEAIGCGRSTFYEKVLPNLKTVQVSDRKRVVAITELQRFLDTNGDFA